jgi:hypothetical protein
MPRFSRQLSQVQRNLEAALWLERDGPGAALSWSERLEAQLLHRGAAGLLKPAKPE